MQTDVVAQRSLTRVVAPAATLFNLRSPAAGSFVVAPRQARLNTLNSVIAIDIDPEKIALAKNNAAVYGVADRIDFRIADVCTTLPTLHADVVFISPPWGGPQYRTQQRSSLHDMHVGERSVVQLFRAARRVSRSIALFLPRNVDRDELEQMAGQGNLFEIEQNRWVARDLLNCPLTVAQNQRQSQDCYRLFWQSCKQNVGVAVRQPMTISFFSQTDNRLRTPPLRFRRSVATGENTSSAVCVAVPLARRRRALDAVQRQLATKLAGIDGSCVCLTGARGVGCSLAAGVLSTSRRRRPPLNAFSFSGALDAATVAD